MAFIKTANGFVTTGGRNVVYKDMLTKLAENSFEADDVPDLGNLTSIPNNLFNGKTSLKNLPDLRNITVIGTNAFQNCHDLNNIVIPAQITNIYSSAFSDATSMPAREIIFKPSENTIEISSSAFRYNKISKLDIWNRPITTIGEYAFADGSYLFEPIEINSAYSTSISKYAFSKVPIKSIKGKFNGISERAFEGIGNTDPLKEIDIDCLSWITSRAFQEHWNVEHCHVKCNLQGSNTGTSNAMFNNIGKNFPNHEIFIFDYSNNIGMSCWSNNCFNGVFNFYLYGAPNVATAYSGSFSGCKNFKIFHRGEKVTTCYQGTNIFSGSSNYLNFVPFDYMQDWRNATVWGTIEAVRNSLRGWIPEATTTNLPICTKDGYVCTWYSDENLQNPVSIAEIGKPYYCEVANEKTHIKVLKYRLQNCIINITDGINSYNLGDYIPIGTEVTISCIPNAGFEQIYSFKLNDVDIPNNHTVIVNEDDFIIDGVCWDGEDLPVLPNFADNDWEHIKRGCQLGLAADYWAIDDEKDLLATDGNTYTIRITDLQDGRYKYADTEAVMPTRAVFEAIAVAPTAYPLHNSNKTNLTFDKLDIYSQLNDGGAIYNLLPNDLQPLIDNIILTTVSNPDSSGKYETTTCKTKLFIPSSAEVGYRNTYGIIECKSPYNEKTYNLFDKYAQSSYTNIGKNIVNTETAANWAVRTPYDSSYNFLIAGSSKSSWSLTGMTNNRYVAFWWAW